MRKFARTFLTCALLCAACGQFANAHGIVGDRFFPPTITTDDPFAVDELALPTISYNKDSDGKETDAGFEFDKEILPHFAIGVSDTHIWENPAQGKSFDGWDNLSLTAKYQFWQNDPHEMILAVGIESDIGGTGSKNTADSFSTITPNFYFGKGFGDLPDSLNGLKPFAVTGVIGEDFPTSSENPNALEWGFAVEYSLPYLQQHVNDVGLTSPLKNMIPLVEFAMTTTENRGQGGLTTGTINPGILWETPHFQLGVEALIPVNHETGDHVGFVVQMWIFIDDLFPKEFGHPLFGD
jgi:hypothetical protein